MTGMRGSVAVVVVGLAWAMSAAPAAAGMEADCSACAMDDSTCKTACAQHTSYGDGMLHKLGRGITNVVTSPGELIRQPYYASRQHGAIGGTVIGLVKGVVWTVGRAGSGVYDVVTFPVNNPKGFTSLIKPEFVYAHGDWTEPVQ